MRAYAVYDRKTGDIVHVHVDPAGMETPREELLQMAAPDGKRALDVLELPDGRMPERAVRVEGGKLREAKEARGTGAGGGAERFPEPAGERSYERADRTGGESSGR